MQPTSKHGARRVAPGEMRHDTATNLQSMEKVAAALLDTVGAMRHDTAALQMALPDEPTQKQKIADFAKAGL